MSNSVWFNNSLLIEDKGEVFIVVVANWTVYRQLYSP